MTRLILIWLTSSMLPPTRISSPLSSSERGAESITSEPREYSLRWRTARCSVRRISYGLVRVGGGFLHLDEFLKIHVPIELEKMARNSPANVLNRALAVNKMTAGRMVGGTSPSKISPLTYKNALNMTQTLN